MHFIAVHPAGQFMKAGGIGPSHSKRKTTCLIVLQSLCSGAPRSAWVATVHIFGIFFFFFFFIFSLFFRPRGGGGLGTLKVSILKGMLSYVCSFAAWDACRRSESEEWPSPVFPKFIAYSRHQSGVRSRYWPDYFHWRCWSLQL